MNPIPRQVHSDGRVDRFGTVTSSLCAAHCAVCSLLPTALGALGLGFLLDQKAEWAFALLAVALAFGALVLGWRRHRSPRVATLLILGIVGLLTSRCLEMSTEHHHGDHGHETLPNSTSITNMHHAPKTLETPGTNALSHVDVSHQLGATLGILAGALLLAGHALNLRANRPCLKQHPSS